MILLSPGSATPGPVTNDTLVPRDGNTGRERLYQLNVSISLSANSLTKVVVFSPYYKVLNRAPYTLELQHQHHNTWITLKQVFNQYVM